MKAWQLQGFKSLEPITNTGAEPNYSPEIPEEDHIKVKVIKTSISASDIGLYLGSYKTDKRILCRSAIGLVSESDYDSYKTGQRIFLSPYSNTVSGYKTRGVDADGFLGDFFYLSLNDIFTLPDGVKDEEVIFIEDIALAINALERIALNKGEYILLYGASYINIIIAELAMYYQSIPIIVDKDQELLDLSEEKGVYYTVNLSVDNLEQKLVEITAGKMVNHLVFDTDCYTEINEFTDYVRKGGKICLVGFNKSPGAISCNLSNIVSGELTVIGVNDGHSLIPSAINMIANKVIDTDNLIEREVGFDDVPDTFIEMSSKNNYLKTVVSCR